MKSILLITSEFPPQPGGIGNHAHQLATYLSQQYEVSVLADQRSEQGEEEKTFDASQSFEVIRVKRYALIFWTYFMRITKSFQQSKEADLILVSGKFPLWIGGLLSLFSEKPIVAIIHGSEVQLSQSLAKGLTNWSLSRFDLVISVSKFTLSLVSHLKLKSSVVIPNGFDLPVYFSDIDSGEFNTASSDEGALNLITVGNLTQRKGQHNVIKALPLLLKTYPHLMYHCVGIPTNQEKLEALSKSLGVEAHVKFHGRMSEEQKFKLLQRSDLFMMLSEQTSTGDVEGFGIAILEANAVGLPAIGSINCGIEDAIQTDYSGQLVDPHDAEAIETAVIEIMTHQNTYSKKAKAWSENFTWDKIGERYVEVLGEFV